MRRSRLSLFILFTFTTNAALATDLLDAYHSALGQDAVFASARAARQAGQEKLTQGRSLLLPNINFSLNSTYNDATNQYAGQSVGSQYNSSNYGVNLVQPLFRHQNWQVYSESELQVAISEAQYKLAEHDLILRVAQSYFDVLIAQDTIQLTATQKQAISEQLEQAKRNFEVGTATITDTYEAQARYDLVVALEVSAQSNLEVRKRALQQITNTLIGDLRPLSDGLKLESPQPADMEKWVADALQHNVQLSVSSAASQLAEKEVSRNLGGNYPTLDLVANYGKNLTSILNVGAVETTSKSIGVQFNLPLYQGGAIQSKYREAEANLDKAKQDLENARRTVTVQTRQAYLGVVSGISQVKALQQALKSSESLLEASKLGQSVGVRTNLDVLNAQQQLYSTRRDLYQAEYNYLISRLRLKDAVGTLSGEDVSSINQALH